MAVIRAKEVPQKIVEHLGYVFKPNSVESFIKKTLRDTIKELSSQAEVINSRGWRKMRAKYIAHIDLLKNDIIQLTKNTKENTEKIQRTNDLVRTMEVFINITDEILESYNRNVELEGQAEKTEPAKAG